MFPGSDTTGPHPPSGNARSGGERAGPRASSPPAGTFVEIEAPWDESARVSRAARMPDLVAVEGDVHGTLDELKVIVIGAGAVGRSIALNLARLQTGELGIVDPGFYKPESLLTQAVSPQDIGHAKASNTARACKAISPGTRVLAWDGSAEDLPTTAFDGIDVVMLATDNLPVEVHADQRCLRQKIPLFQGSVHGDTLTVQVRSLGHGDGFGPCLACGYGKAEWARLADETEFSCEGGPQQPARTSQNAETRSVSFLCEMAADLCATQMLRHVLGLGAPVADTILEYCLYTHRARSTPLRRNDRCPCDHVDSMLAESSTALQRCTLRDLAAEAGVTLAAPIAQVWFYVDELSFVEASICGCGHSEPLGRFMHPGEPVGSCPRCRGGSLSASSFHSHRPAAGAVILSQLDRPIGELVPHPPRWVEVSVGDRSVRFQSPAQAKAEFPAQE